VLCDYHHIATLSSSSSLLSQHNSKFVFFPHLHCFSLFVLFAMFLFCVTCWSMSSASHCISKWTTCCFFSSLFSHQSYNAIAPTPTLKASFQHCHFFMAPFYFFREVSHLLVRTLVIFILKIRTNLLGMCMRPRWVVGLNFILRTTQSYFKSFQQKIGAHNYTKLKCFHIMYHTFKLVSSYLLSSKGQTRKPMNNIGWKAKENGCKVLLALYPWKQKA
jgi:hypothetical protein